LSQVIGRTGVWIPVSVVAMWGVQMGSVFVIVVVLLIVSCVLYALTMSRRIEPMAPEAVA
jgi:hypothetical protein